MPSPTYVPLNPTTDMISYEKVVTSGFFTGGKGSLDGGNLVTKSLSTTQKNYYYNMQYSSEDQLSVTYGHDGGSGSSQTFASNNVYGETQAIYNHFASLLLPPDQQDIGFVFTGSQSDITRDNSVRDIYVLVAERKRMKDRLNPKNWTIQLSGSGPGNNKAFITSSGVMSQSILHLTDDSSKTGDQGSPVGEKYYIMSGSSGTTKGSTRFGFFYPDMGIMVFNVNEMSGALPGTIGFITSSTYAFSSTEYGRGNGLAPDTNNNTNADNALKFAWALSKGTQTLRAEENQLTTAYFCRATAPNFNFSANPTFLSGSEGRFAVSEFESDPNTFITTVGLYDGADGDLVAVGRLSTPILKNYETEATIKVNLTY